MGAPKTQFPPPIVAIPMVEEGKCGAFVKSTGLACGQPVQPGSDRCYFHGGRSLAGIAHPRWRTGRYSRDLPARMLEKFNEAVEDPELTNMREDIALIDARLSELLQRVDHGESGALWGKLQKAVLQFRDAQKKMDAGRNVQSVQSARVKRDEALDLVVELVSEGSNDYQAWREIENTLEMRRKLVKGEQERLVAAEQMITNEQAMVMQAQILAIIRTHVTEPHALAAISKEFVKLSMAGAG